MRNLPHNRFDIQVVFEGGAYLRFQSRKGGLPSREELLTVLEKFIADQRAVDAELLHTASKEPGEE